MTILSFASRAVAAGLLLLTSYRPASAFKTPGHIAIEHRAIDLLAAWHTADPAKPSREAVVRAVYGLPGWTWTAAAPYPEARSQFPDASGERQFAQDLQAYHFMSGNKPVVLAARLPHLTPAAKMHVALLASLPDCLLLMRFLLWEACYNPPGASDAGRGIFVLMHVVADSYSPEHTTRVGATGDLQLVKGWRLSRPAWPRDAREGGTSSQQHRMVHGGAHAPGDEQWANSSLPGGLAPQAEQAAKALAEVMTLFYSFQQQHLAEAQRNQAWREYLLEYFRPYGSQLPLAATAFEFAGTEEKIAFQVGDGQYDYLNTGSSLETAYDYDFHTGLTWLATAQMASNRAPAAPGLEIQDFLVPGSADRKGALLRRFEYGGALAAKLVPNRRPGETTDAHRTLQTNSLLAVNLFPLPYANGMVQARAGVGSLPFDDFAFGYVVGIDVAWNIGAADDHTPLRLVLGYEHNGLSLPMPDMLSLKLGFNRWKARLPE